MASAFPYAPMHPYTHAPIHPCTHAPMNLPRAESPAARRSVILEFPAGDPVRMGQGPMRRFSIGVVLVSLLQVASAARGQAPAQGGPPSTSTFTTRATAILVDVVVRDKKGALVTDLSTREFEIAEDGVRQTVGSFAVVNHGGGVGIG